MYIEKSKTKELTLEQTNEGLKILGQHKKELLNKVRLDKIATENTKKFITIFHKQFEDEFFTDTPYGVNELKREFLWDEYDSVYTILYDENDWSQENSIQNHIAEEIERIETKIKYLQMLKRALKKTKTWLKNNTLVNKK